jgi:23S rRNA pseudouridine1911/1915/1917 synthase
MNIHITIQEDQKDIRLDSLVADKIGLTRRNAALLANKGDILVNEQVRKPGYKVKPGDCITGSIPDPGTESVVLSENIDLDIVFEDEHLMVINKKPGMVVHPAPGHLSGTLVNAVLFHEPDIENAGTDKFRAGIVHRLDKDTSGLMVVAKTQQALTFLQREFKQRRVEKQYLALILGNPVEEHGEINLPIGRHPVKRRLMAVNHETGRPARTLWHIQQRFKTACLVQVLLKTGRTHQIRVHFYAMGYPLMGDLTYQPRRFRKKKSLAPRQMLHSWQLAFRHPYSGQRVLFNAPLPEDFLAVKAGLKPSAISSAIS